MTHRILVVDDDVAAAEALGELLRDYGHDVAKRVRSDLGLGDALLVVLSGHGGDRHRRLASEAGFDQHVTEPVDISKLEEPLKLSL